MSKAPPNIHSGKRSTFWQNSTYDEPTWVSLAWILVPVLVAGIAIYFALQ